MTWWTTCNMRYREYDFPNDRDGRIKMLKRAIRRFLPEVDCTPENFDRVTWHFEHEDCPGALARPIDELLADDFTLRPDDEIHLHAPLTVEEERKEGEEEEEEEEDWKGFADNEIDDGGDSDDEIQESADHEPETSDMRNNLDHRELYVKVIYNLDGIPGTNKDMWTAKPEEVLHFSRQRTLPELFTLLAGFAERKFESTEPERYHDMAHGNKKETLFLRPHLQHDSPVKRRAFNFDKSGISRIAAINDLLDDETERGHQPQLTIMLTFVGITGRNRAADPLVIIRSGAESPGIGGVATFHRIGTRSGSEGPETHSVAISSTYFWRCKSEDDLSDVRFVEAFTWSLRGMTICNPDEGLSKVRKSITLKPSDTVGPTTLDQFLKDLKKLDKGSLHPYTEGRLLYNYESWLRGAALSHQVPPIETTSEFPEPGITVAVRYINHLQDDAIKKFHFEAGDEYVLEENDDHESLCKEIQNSLRRHKPMKGFKGDWDIELWIMPQIPNGRTLFKFKGDSELVDWLHKPCVEAGDAVLFAEAHIIPVV